MNSGKHVCPTETSQNGSFAKCLLVTQTNNAAFFAADLFWDSFRAAFPEPPDHERERWHQYVALYRWPNQLIEVVGFCNWIHLPDIYLQGGMCVRANFYHRLCKVHFRECAAAGGVAQLMMEAAASQLHDCAAWFGYCGDQKAMRVNLRVGYTRTRYPNLIVRWFTELSDESKLRLIDRAAAIGPF